MRGGRNSRGSVLPRPPMGVTFCSCPCSNQQNCERAARHKRRQRTRENERGYRSARAANRMRRVPLQMIRERHIFKSFDDKFGPLLNACHRCCFRFRVLGLGFKTCPIEPRFVHDKKRGLRGRTQLERHAHERNTRATTATHADTHSHTHSQKRKYKHRHARATQTHTHTN